MKILWLKSEILHPVDKGGKIRSYEMLRNLKRHHAVTYISFRQGSDTADSIGRSVEYADRLITVDSNPPRRYSAAFYADLAANVASGLPYAIQKYQSEQMRNVIQRVLREDNYDLLVCDFLTPSINLPGKIPIPSIIFQHNVESQIWRRHYQTSDNMVEKAYFYGQFRRMQRFEGKALRQFDAVVAVSEADRNTMSQLFGVDRIYCVPTGVDTTYYAPGEHNEGAREDAPNRNPYELVFTGSMDYLPNEDAILYFAESILPIILQRQPEVTLTVVGRNPTPRIIALARSNPTIKVTGAVPDVRPYVGRAACFIVPIRIGGGTRLKIFEAMAMAKPVVSSSIGAEGLPVSDGVDLFLADDAHAFAERVLEVIADRKMAERIACQGRALVTSKFSWESVTEEFVGICGQVASKARRSRAA